MDNQKNMQAMERFLDHKGRPYQYLMTAYQNETGEEMAVYQALFGDHKIYVAAWRSFTDIRKNQQEQIKAADTAAKKTSGSGFDLYDFLDARTTSEKLAILNDSSHRFDETTLESMAMSVDFVLKEKTAESMLEELKGCLMTKLKYESGRLR